MRSFVRFITSFATICAVGTASDRASASDDRPTILVAGDSLGVGLSPKLKELGKSCGYRVVTSSIGGTTTLQWSKWLPKKIAAVKPDVVVLSLGTNDAGLWGKWTLEHPDVVDTIVKTVEEAGSELVWVGPPELPRRALPLRDPIVGMIAAKVSMFFDSSEVRDGKAPDQIHYTPAGYAAWADSVWFFMCAEGIVPCLDD